VPVYDYDCAACGQQTEVIHGIDAPGPRFCPVCGAEGTLRKAFAPLTVHFKGSGWAKKDRSTSRAKTKPAGDGADSAGATTETAATGTGDGTSGSKEGDAGSSTKVPPAYEPGKGAAGAAQGEG
jgi:putative FmdB family regulatory protein